MRLIFIPYRNEVATLSTILEQVRQETDDDILIVDDASDIPIASRPGIAVLRHDVRQGYGGAMLSGFRYATERNYATVVSLDADLQHDATDLGTFFSVARSCDVASGTRYHPHSRVVGTPPGDRKSINETVTQWIRCITGYDITDAFCGFKAYRVDAIKRLNLSETGPGFPIQFWIQAWHAGLTIEEVPTARIYLDANRRFGGTLDDADRRLAYYEQVLADALRTVEALPVPSPLSAHAAMLLEHGAMTFGAPSVRVGPCCGATAPCPGVPQSVRTV